MFSTYRTTGRVIGELSAGAFFHVSALTKSEALAQCIMFFLAGRDTSATLLAHAIYLLALYPEAQAKLRKEADECFEKHVRKSGRGVWQS